LIAWLDLVSGRWESWLRAVFVYGIPAVVVAMRKRKSVMMMRCAAAAAAL
jgi:hypothetical protein